MPKRPSMLDRRQETPRGASQADSVLMGRERAHREVIELLLQEVMPNRLQPRTTFREESLDELAESIQLHGVLEPVIVRVIPLTPFEGHARQYELIAGERRWRAAARAGATTIPALVLPEATTDQAALELAITENLQREDLHPLDEAVAFGRMQQELGYSYAQIAERLGKSKGYVQNRLRLLQLDEDLQHLVAERPDTLSHVYELAKIVDPAQRGALIVAVRDEGLSLAQTRSRVQALLAPPSEAPEPYLRKYDRDVRHEDEGYGPPYLRKYDRDARHEDEEGDADPDDSARPLPGRRRRALSPVAVAASKVERLLARPEELTEEDRAILRALALRLRELTG